MMTWKPLSLVEMYGFTLLRILGLLKPDVCILFLILPFLRIYLVPNVSVKLKDFNELENQT